jgi:hypothetical protein
MSENRSPLESPELFSAYCERIKQQLQESVEERLKFLESASAQLTAFEALARKSGNIALTDELLQLNQHAGREVAALRNDGPVQALTSSAHAVVNQPSEGQPAQESLSQPSDLPATAVTNAPSEPRTYTYYPSAQPRPTPPPRPILPPVPKTPSRPLEEVYRDTDRLTEQAEQEGDIYSETKGLIRLKALLCRQRALQAELAAQDIQHWPLRQLLNYIRRRIDDGHGVGHYLIPLRAELWPTEAWPWHRLADLYDSLADAHEALDWYDAEAEKLNQPERQELLESIASHQTRLWRHLQTYFPRQNDEHQINFFRELCAIAEEEDVYLYSLQERCPDEALEEKAEALPTILESLKVDRKNRAKREAALQQLRVLVSDPDFGTREGDPEALDKAVVRCRKEGAPASSVTLRSILADWVSLIEESKEKGVQEVAREIQKEADRLIRKAEFESAEPEQALSESEQAELDAVRALLRGKKCLFIGGICREESRQRLERELELTELVWPSTNGTESVYRFEPDIQNTDVTVVLVRFMRTGWGQARELALRHEKMFVRLPAGYGLKQVVRQLHRQLVHAPHEEPVANAAK